mmetsp:Transcript_10823/g.17324  ORF Transcript_10823/g.17324 Transcript_10823/m.17324 type:complete len:262 (-) Transcript_10823:61-846(-)
MFHKNHNEKVMTIAFTGLVYDGNIEEGGRGVKLGFFRCCAARQAKKLVRKGTKDANGKLRYNGAPVRQRGQLYFVDCSVTGSDQGTSDDPKFSLKTLFHDVIFPRISTLVGPDGDFNGYLPVIQGDNAGPHTDREFQEYVTSHCAEKGWKWEPQAPQMPHANNLDLAVFPAMSKRHSAYLAKSGNSMAKPDEIWENAERVWNQLSSNTIARGFLHAHRILKKVIVHKGDNSFLLSKDFHTGVSRDYYDDGCYIRKVIRSGK